MNALRAGCAYFASVFAVGFLLGALRVFVIEPEIGALAAVLVETPFILAASWMLCRYWVRRFNVPPETAPRLFMGFTAFGLLLAAELILGFYGFERSVADQLAAYKQAPGAVGLASQALFGLFPLIRVRLS